MSYSQMIKDIFYNVIELETHIEKNEKNTEDKENVIRTLNDAKDFIIYCEKDPKNLYFDDSYDQMQYYYFDGIFIYFIGVMFTKDEYEKKRYDFFKAEKIYYEAYKDGELCRVLTWVHNKVKAFTFTLFYEKMTNEEKFKAFVEMYKYSENSSQSIPQEILEDMINYVPKDIIQKRKQNKLFNKFGYMEVLRGQGSKSTEGKEAMSWTIDLKIANFFAYRYGDDGYVVKGKVHINDVIMIFDEEYDDGNDYCKDPEKEILVAPGSVKEIKKIKTSKGK